MPVRIYDIAKRLGVESKVVLKTAKELGITHARVASSTIDKITAEYLEGKLHELGYGQPAPAPAVEQTPPVEPQEAAPAAVEAGPTAVAVEHPAAEVEAAPVAAEIAQPAPPVAEVPATQAPQPVEVAAQPAPPTEVEVQTAVQPAPPEIAQAPEPVTGVLPTEIAPAPVSEAVSPAPPAAATPIPEISVGVETPVTQQRAGEPMPVLPVAEPGEKIKGAEPMQPQVQVSPEPSALGKPEGQETTPQPVRAEEVAARIEQPVSEPKAQAPATAAAVPASLPATPAPPSPPAPAPAAPASPPPPPPPPPKPRVGDKVGFIQLPSRPKPQEKAGGRPAQRPGFGKGEGQKSRETAPAGRGAGAGTTYGQRGVGGVGAPPRRDGGSVAPARPTVPVPTGEEISLKPPVTVRSLAEALKKKPFQVIADLMEMGVFATVNQTVDPDDAQRVCAKYNFRFKLERRQEGGGIHKPPPRRKVDLDEKPELLKPRAPVVTIMGHVDHGKTTLLDVIRKSNVAANEAGGITQHIGAYTIEVPRPGKPKETAQITFLDTPGHAAFSAMRARGANVTDIVVLVVAANDGVMPQTLEAISHAKEANVPIVVAINKCDHPNANPLRVRQQLQERGLVPDEWGGDTMFVEVSAVTKQGVDKLLEAILLQAELLELKANPNRPAAGNVIESGIEAGGPVATLLVRKGTLSVGDVVVCDKYYGKVRALINEERKRLKQAGPSMAVRMLGLNGVPEAGAEFSVVAGEKEARELCEQRAEAERASREERRMAMTLSDLMSRFEKESAKVLKLVVKGDTQGSVEAIADALEKIESEKVSLEIIHSAVGMVNESDVLLASASKAVILGFHTRVDAAASELAKRDGVEIRLYEIIYELIDDVRKAMAGLLEPIEKEVVLGTAEVRKVFLLSKGGSVAGCVVSNGRIVKGKARVVRRKNVLFDGTILTLRRFQDEVTEVRTGMECGIRMAGFDDYAEGDIIECYSIEKVAQEL
ncbi:MAG: translation initiation factor IF-2 [Verrucomicrobia bacterium]|nr:translation initiation factor IF-2 [Verrucomicrobiota bacterium]